MSSGSGGGGGDTAAELAQLLAPAQRPDVRSSAAAAVAAHTGGSGEGQGIGAVFPGLPASASASATAAASPSSLSSSSSSAACLRDSHRALLRALVRLAFQERSDGGGGDDDTTTAARRSSLSALVNVTAEYDAIALYLIGECDAVERCIQSLVARDDNDNDTGGDSEKRQRGARARPDSLYAALLANLTRLSAGQLRALGRHTRGSVSAALSDGAELVAEHRLLSLLDRLRREAPDYSGFHRSLAHQQQQSLPLPPADALEHVAVVFGNVSCEARGRQLLLNNRAEPLCALAESCLLRQQPNPARRLGAATAVRNCCGDIGGAGERLDWVAVIGAHLVSRHMRLDDDDDDHDRLAEMPASVQAAIRTRAERDGEPSSDVRLQLAEALLMLCRTRRGREAIRARHIYPVLREAHRCEVEKSAGDGGGDSRVAQTLELVVQRTELASEDVPVDADGRRS